MNAVNGSLLGKQSVVGKNSGHIGLLSPPLRLPSLSTAKDIACTLVGGLEKTICI